MTVKGAEMLDYKSLSSVNDPVFLKYKGEVASLPSPAWSPATETGLTAVLTETKARTPEELQQNISAIEACLQAFTTYIPVRFTDRPEEYSNTGPSVPASSPLWRYAPAGNHLPHRRHRLPH